MLEKQIEQKLNAEVKKLGALTYKWISTVTGVPDRIVVYKGKVYFVELKTPQGVLSARQHVVFADLLAQGTPVTVIRSESDIVNFVQRLKDET